MPAQDSDYCLSEPETLLQSHQLPEASDTDKACDSTMPLRAKRGPGTLQGFVVLISNLQRP